MTPHPSSSTSNSMCTWTNYSMTRIIVINSKPIRMYISSPPSFSLPFFYLSLARSFFRLLFALHIKRTSEDPLHDIAHVCFSVSLFVSPQSILLFGCTLLRLFSPLSSYVSGPSRSRDLMILDSLRLLCPLPPHLPSLCFLSASPPLLSPSSSFPICLLSCYLKFLFCFLFSFFVSH